MEMVATTLYALALITQGECPDGSKLYKCLTQDPILNKLPWIISHVMAGSSIGRGYTCVSNNILNFIDPKTGQRFPQFDDLKQPRWNSLGT